MLVIQPTRDFECAAKRPFPLVRSQAAQRRRCPSAAQCHHLTRNSAPRRQGVCDDDRLIETALPNPPAMQRDGDQDGSIGHPVGQNRSDRSRKPRPAGVFQAQNDPFGDIAVSNCCNNRIIIGPLCKAVCARQIVGQIKRPRTMHTTRRRQERKLRPARRTKAMIVFDDCRTTGASRRQHEIKNRAEETHTPVVEPVNHRHKYQMASASDNVPQLFDRRARRLRRQRAKGCGFFAETMSSDLLERLDCVKRAFSDALVVGDQPLIADGLKARGIAFDRYTGDEDRLGGSDEAYDLILSSGTLDTVSDLPGALILMRRALKPDGLLLANFPSAPSLTALRSAAAVADAESGHAIARFHPQIDVRSAGDLLMRAGFALPVADLSTVNVAYSSFARLLTDLREAAATNVLVQRYPVSRRWFAAATNGFAALAGQDGRTHETLSYVTLTAWAPAPSQPQPAKRGSGVTSLTEALRRRRD